MELSESYTGTPLRPDATKHVSQETRPYQLNVLHIEDDPIDAMLFKWIAEAIPSYWFDIRCVGTLAEATEALTNAKFDLCIVDFWLGQEGALKFLPLISFSAPVIVLSGVADLSTRENCLRVGASAVMKKLDLTSTALESVIRSVLRRDAGSGET